MQKLLLLCCLFIFSCAHKASAPEVSKFIQTWEKQLQTNEGSYAKVYEKYLNSVKDVYVQNGESKKFASYMDSLNLNLQILTDQVDALPQQYKKETGRKYASLNDSDYQQYKIKTLTKLYNKLFIARELKIQDEVGEGLYQELQANYDKFMLENNARKHGLPL